MIPKQSGPTDCSYQLPQTPVSENELSLWAQYAALKSFEYSFDKLDDQLQKLKYCFTDQGWTGFHDALQQSGNLSVIKSQQLTVSSQISSDPVINRIKENQWSISLPLSVVYQNTQEKFTQSLSVTLFVTKKTPTELGIMQLIMNFYFSLIYLIHENIDSISHLLKILLFSAIRTTLFN